MTLPPSRTPPPPGTGSFLHESGLCWRRDQPRAWLRDSHFRLALLAALPVWWVLAIWTTPHMRGPVGVGAWVSLTLFYPLVEEVIFRGILQGQALALLSPRGCPMRLGPLTLANLLVTVGFVLAHLPAQPLGWALAVAVPSLVLGHLRERFSSVWPSVALHVIYNTGFSIIAARAGG